MEAVAPQILYRPIGYKPCYRSRTLSEVFFWACFCKEAPMITSGSVIPLASSPESFRDCRAGLSRRSLARRRKPWRRRTFFSLLHVNAASYDSAGQSLCSQAVRETAHVVESVIKLMARVGDPREHRLGWI